MTTLDTWSSSSPHHSISYNLYPNLSKSRHFRFVGQTSNLATTVYNPWTEIIEYCAPDEVAICTVASLTLPASIDVRTASTPKFLTSSHNCLTHSLNKIIEVNHHPVEEARDSNIRHHKRKGIRYV